MAQSSSHVKTLRTFGKFLREEKNKVDKEYVNKIIPVLSEIKYADHTIEEIQELIESVKEVLENVETHKSVASIEVELHKASANLEKARNELLTHTRRESGRKVITGSCSLYIYLLRMVTCYIILFGFSDRNIYHTMQN